VTSGDVFALAIIVKNLEAIGVRHARQVVQRYFEDIEDVLLLCLDGAHAKGRRALCTQMQRAQEHILVVARRPFVHDKAFMPNTGKKLRHLNFGVLVELAVDFHPQLLPDVENISCHGFDVNRLDVGRRRQRTDVVNKVVDILDQAHFDQDFIAGVKGIAHLKRPREKVAQKNEDFGSTLEAHVLDANAWIN